MRETVGKPPHAKIAPTTLSPPSDGRGRHRRSTGGRPTAAAGQSIRLCRRGPCSPDQGRNPGADYSASRDAPDGVTGRRAIRRQTKTGHFRQTKIGQLGRGLSPQAWRRGAGPPGGAAATGRRGIRRRTMRESTRARAQRLRATTGRWWRHGSATGAPRPALMAQCPRDRSVSGSMPGAPERCAQRSWRWQRSMERLWISWRATPGSMPGRQRHSQRPAAPGVMAVDDRVVSGSGAMS